jgi:hypothetical protein
MFEFKFQKWFDQILGSIEFPTNFRIFELLNLIQIKPNGKRQTALFIWAKTGQPKPPWVGSPSIGTGESSPMALGSGVGQIRRAGGLGPVGKAARGTRLWAAGRSRLTVEASPRWWDYSEGGHRWGDRSSGCWRRW